ncbi:hypothetical protein BH20ACI1_BH20ACI1_23670 [soil metagenome]
MSEEFKALIDIFPSGKSKIEFVHQSKIKEIKLMKIALLYAVKIAYLLESEPTEMNDAYKNLIEDIVKPLEWFPTGKMTERLSEIATMLQSQDEQPSAVMECERFFVSLVIGTEIDYVNTEIPHPWLVANLPISAILLSDAVASMLSHKNIEIFENQFRFFTKEMFRNRLMEISDLKRINQAITISLNFADEITNDF